MTYMAGTDGLKHLGIPNGRARVICDGCGVTLSALTSGGGPARWLIRGKHAPGWQGGRKPDGTRWDLCPRCKEKP